MSPWLGKEDQIKNILHAPQYGDDGWCSSKCDWLEIKWLAHLQNKLIKKTKAKLHAFNENMMLQILSYVGLITITISAKRPWMALRHITLGQIDEINEEIVTPVKFKRHEYTLPLPFGY